MLLEGGEFESHPGTHGHRLYLGSLEVDHDHVGDPDRLGRAELAGEDPLDLVLEDPQAEVVVEARGYTRDLEDPRLDDDGTVLRILDILISPWRQLDP